MLIEQIIKQTVDLQGFRVHIVTKQANGFVAEIPPDGRCRIRCGTCGAPSKYRDRRNIRFFGMYLFGIFQSSSITDLAGCIVLRARVRDFVWR